jgi:hypothetical protein
MCKCGCYQYEASKIPLSKVRNDLISNNLPPQGKEIGLGTLSPDEAQIKAMVAKLDIDDSGEIDFDEFRRFFTPVLN